MKTNTKDGLVLLATAVNMFAIVVFLLYTGLSLLKMTGIGNSPVALLIPVSGAIHLVGSMCAFVIALELMCRGIREMKGLKN